MDMPGRDKAEAYRIGIYVRESRDDHEENYETIETQRDLLIDFVGRNHLGTVCRVYTDDNVSGSGFERRGIEQMKSDVTAGYINLLVLKDLSRLGRNNAKTLLFLDFLEEYGVRVITFDGRYDSLRDNDTVGIDTWYNERYIRDISRKIRTNLRFKIERGEYIGHAPYGYRKSMEQKNRLVVDDTTAPIVRDIYQTYKGGFGYGYIAAHLNERRIPPPSCRNTGTPGKLWTAVAVQRILCSRVYIGDTVQGVSEKVSFKSKKTRRLPDSRWVITRKTHPAIVEETDFEEVQRIRAGKRNLGSSHKGRLHSFKGKLFCGGCGNPLFARIRKNRPAGYICGNYCKNGSKACSSHHINEDFLEKLVLEELKALLGNDKMREKLGTLLEKEMRQPAGDGVELQRLEQQVTARQKQQDVLYTDRLEGRISEQLFVRMNQNLEGRLVLVRQELEKIRTRMDSTMDVKGLIVKAIEEILESGCSYALVHQLVDRITVYDPGEMEPGNDLSKRMLVSEDTADRGAIVIDFVFGELYE
jgi:site-specific DNA recombinase